MLERDKYPAGVPCWVDTDQPDPDAAAEFYGGLFGWEFDDRMPVDAPVRYFVAELRGNAVAGVGGRPDDAPETPVAWNSYVSVESADDAAASVKANGGSVVMEPFDVLAAGRMAVLTDPEGAVFCVWEAKSQPGAVLVNEPSTWNFSELNSRDLEGAKRFYGAAFGWETSSFSFGGADYTMFRMPGYGEFLAERDPELYERQDEGGAPEGFADAVAWLQPITDDAASVSEAARSYYDDQEASPHWSITFAVDDADAAASQAAELGGTIDVAPFDAGPTRVAVVTDPQGATFTVSKFTPPNE
jgi:predicted enzyme related to lactoylglutathione lyase